MKNIFTLAFVALALTSATAQDFMLQSWYWGYPSSTGGRRWIKNMEAQAPQLANAGFTHIYMPPLSSGSSANSMGYDTRDYFDIGRYVSCRWGTFTQYNQYRQVTDGLGLKMVADMVYNHRDGGGFEANPAVEGWIENMTLTKINAGDQPYPSDRYRLILPLGGTSGNGAGTYYIKVSSRSGAPAFAGKAYTFRTWTNLLPTVRTAVAEVEPNGGGDCAQANQTATLGTPITCTLDAVAGCRTDEFALTLSASDFRATGDTLYISLMNGGGLGDQTDHDIYGIWSGARSMDVKPQVIYQTATLYNAANTRSGRGFMNYMSFRPNGNPTTLGGEQDEMLFFYDIDQTRQATRDTLFEWTKWMWQDRGIRGFRIDAIKHFPASFTGDLFDYLYDNGIAPDMVVGESFEFDPNTLRGRVDAINATMNPATRAAVNIRLFDFTLRGTLNTVCNNPSADARSLFGGSMVDGGNATGFNVVTFVNNHDFRGAGGSGDPISRNMLPAYAYMLTNNKLGVPCIYYPDYYQSLTTMAAINGLIKVNKRYINGSNAKDYLNNTGSFYGTSYVSGANNRSVIFQTRNAISGKDCIVAINFDSAPLEVNQFVNGIRLSPGDTLTDIFRNSGGPLTMQVPANYQLNLKVPANSFAIWVEGDLRSETIDLTDTLLLGNEEVLEMPKQDLMIFPNPSNGAEINLAFMASQSGTAQLLVTDMMGRSVHSEMIELQEGANAHRFNLSDNLANGLYIVQVRAAGGAVSESLLLER